MEDWQKQRAELRVKRYALAHAIAAALGATVEQQKGDPDPIDEARYISLILAGRKFTLYFWQGKITVSGSWPKERQQDGSEAYRSPRDLGVLKYDQAEQDIGVSEERGAEAIAKDIKRRFLPEFVRVWDACVEKMAAREACGRSALAAARELVGACRGINATRGIKSNGQEANLYHDPAGPIRVSVYDGRASIRIERSLDGLTLKQAKAILKILEG